MGFFFLGVLCKGVTMHGVPRSRRTMGGGAAWVEGGRVDKR